MLAHLQRGSSEDCTPPAGIRIFCSEQRSQGQNRERAMAMLRSRLYDMELEKQRAAESAKRKSQVRPGVMPHHRLRAENGKVYGKSYVTEQPQ